MWLLAWGLFAPDRGFFRDEAWIFNALEDSRGFAARWLWVGGFSRADSPQRVLTGVPFALSALTPAPELSLHLLYGVTWLFSAAAAGALAAVLDPRRRALAAFTAAGLALTACGDASFAYSASLVAQGSAGAFVAALALLFQAWRSARVRWLVWAWLPLSLSLWSYDTALPAALVTPLILWALDGLRLTRRVLWVGAGWSAAVLPYLAVFVYFARLPGSYAQRALPAQRLDEVVTHFAQFVATNFLPWTWARLFRQDDRDLFAWGLPAPLPWLVPVMALGTLAFAACVVRLRRRGAPQAPLAGAVPGVCGALLLLALASNAGYAWVADAPAVFRTQLVSRLLVSVVLALLAAALPRGIQALALLTPFVAFGLQAGLAAQCAHLGVWRAQKAALSALARVAPTQPPGSALVVYVPPQVTHHPLTAAGASNIWLRLLHGRAGAAFVWSEQVPGQQCRFEASGLRCGSTGTLLPWRSTRLVSYLPEHDAFVPASGLEPADPELLRAAARGRLRPAAERLLARGEGLGRFVAPARPSARPQAAPPQPLCTLNLLRGLRVVGARRDRLDRWFDRRALLEVGSGAPATLRLSVDLSPVFPPDVVTLTVNDAVVARLDLPQAGARTLELRGVPLRAGANELRFTSTKPSVPPGAAGQDLPFVLAEKLEVACESADAAGPEQALAPADDGPVRALHPGSPCVPVTHRPRLVRAAMASDFDGDGHSDLLLRSERDGSLRVWFLERESCAAQAEITPAPGTRLRVSGVADFDGDGRSDLALQDDDGGRVVFWRLGGPTGTRRQGDALELWPQPARELRLIGAADADADGRPDLAFERAGAQSIEIWTLDGFRRRELIRPSPDAAGLTWSSPGVLDVDGDGLLDLLWQNPVTRRVVVWWLGARGVRRGGRFTEPDAPRPGARLGALASRAGARDALLAWQLERPAAIEFWRVDRVGRRLRQAALRVDDWRSWRLVGPR